MNPGNKMSLHRLVALQAAFITTVCLVRFNRNWCGLGASALMLLVTLSGAHAEQLPPQITRFSTAMIGAELPGGWIHRSLPRVERENRFALVAGEGGVVLEVVSDAAASTLIHPLDVDPAQTPLLRWRWSVSNPVRGSDFTRKEGDDYAARVYVLFDFPAERLGLGDRLKISLARSLHGTELPTAAIAYVWGMRQPVAAFGPNPYTDRVQMIVVESGEARAGEWIEYERDVAADFMRLFGEPAPRITGIAVSADTDNTGERVTTRFGDLRFEARE